MGKRSVSPIREDKVDVYKFTWNQIQRILEEAKKLKDPTIYEFLVVLAYSGRRVSEILGKFPPWKKDLSPKYIRKNFVKVYKVVGRDKKGNWIIDKSQYKYEFLPLHGLRWCDINFEKGIITWEIEKKIIRTVEEGEEWQKIRRKEVVLPAHPLVLQILKQRYIRLKEEGKIGHETDRVFPFSRVYAYKVVKKLCEKAGIKNKERLLHAFRHGFAVEMLKRGSSSKDIERLCNYLQHSDIKITMAYAKFTENEEEIRKWLEKL